MQFPPPPDNFSVPSDSDDENDDNSDPDDISDVDSNEIPDDESDGPISDDESLDDTPMTQPPPVPAPPLALAWYPFLTGLAQSAEWDSTNYLRDYYYPDDSSVVFSPIEVPLVSHIFKALARSLALVDSLFHGVAFIEQPQCPLLTMPPEILEVIISNCGAIPWCKAMIACKQLLYVTLDNTFMMAAMLSGFSWAAMFNLELNDLNKFLASFELLPSSLKPVQSVVRGVNVVTEALTDGCFLLRLGVDARRLSWSQSIHSFQTERPWPLHNPDFLVGYFEITIVTSAHDYSAIGIGVAPSDFARNGQMVGWRYNSYAYHSDDGGMYHNYSGWAGSHFCLGNQPAKGKPNDVIGCGVIAESGQLFYTMNGRLMTRPNWKLPKFNESGAMQLFYPTISLLGCGDSAVWNLGGKPFVFDLHEFILSDFKALSMVPTLNMAGMIENI